MERSTETKGKNGAFNGNKRKKWSVQRKQKEKMERSTETKGKNGAFNGNKRKKWSVQRKNKGKNGAFNGNTQKAHKNRFDYLRKRTETNDASPRYYPLK